MECATGARPPPENSQIPPSWAIDKIVRSARMRRLRGPPVLAFWNEAAFFTVGRRRRLCRWRVLAPLVVSGRSACFVPCCRGFSSQNFGRLSECLRIVECMEVPQGATWFRHHDFPLIAKITNNAAHCQTPSRARPTGRGLRVCQGSAVRPMGIRHRRGNPCCLWPDHQ